MHMHVCWFSDHNIILVQLSISYLTTFCVYGKYTIGTRRLDKVDIASMHHKRLSLYLECGYIIIALG